MLSYTTIYMHVICSNGVFCLMAPASGAHLLCDTIENNVCLLFISARPTSLNLNFNLNARLTHQQSGLKSMSNKCLQFTLKLMMKNIV